MANQIIIDIGAVANDGTGDPLRTAFGYVNDNFSNVWATGVANSNVAFDGNKILTVNTNGNLVLAPNGVGKVVANVDIVPNTANTRNLGALNNRWSTVYSQYLNVSNDVDFTGDVTINGNLTVEGDTIQIGNIVTDTKTIQLANTANTANAANGSGVTVGANDDIATILYSSTSNTWVMNIGANVTGNVTAPYFIGNGSQLTGITSYANANAVAYGQAGWAGNIIPSGNAVYSLGNATNQWNDLYVSNATIYMNNVPVSLTSGNVLTVNGQPLLSNDSNTTIATTGNITAGNISGTFVAPATTANTYVLYNDSGVISGSGVFTFNENGNVLTIGTTGGQLRVADISTPQAGVNLRFIPSSGTTLSYGNLNPQFANTYDLGQSGSRWNNMFANVINATSITLNGTGTSVNASGGNILTNQVTGTQFNFLNGLYTVNLNAGQATANYALQLPANAGSSGQALTTDGNGALSWTTISSSKIANGTSNVEIATANGNVTVTAAGSATWNFDTTGNVNLPNNGSVNFAAGGIVQTPDEDLIVTVQDDENDGWSLYNRVTDTGTPLSETRLQRDQFQLAFPVSEKYWQFNDTGIMVTPGDINGPYGSGMNIEIPGASASSFITLRTVDNSSTLRSNLTVATDNVTVSTSNAAYTWTFDNTGNLTVPGNTIVSTANATGGLGGKSISITAGAADQGTYNANAGGSLNITGGLGGFNDDGSGGPGGNVIITAGSPGEAGGVAGNVTINSGSSTWTFDYNNKLSSGPLSITSQFGLGTTGTILENGGTLELIGNGTGGGTTGCVVIGWNSSYGTAGNVAQMYFNPADSTGNIVVTTGNTAGISYEWTFDNTGNIQGNVSLTGPNITINNAGGGNEGAEMAWALPAAANTTLTTSVVQDVYQNGMRFFEGGGTNRGLVMDIGNAPAGTTAAVGYRDVPQITLSGNVTANATNAGRHFYSTTAGNLSITLPDNANVAYPLGATLTVVVNAAGNVLVNEGTGVNLYMAGSSSTGNRVVGAYGLASVMKVATNTWVISGTGVY